VTGLLASTDVALFALLAGLGLIYFEANRPGSILPGCLGVLLILLSVDSLLSHRLYPLALVYVAAGTALTGAAIFRPTLHLLAAAGALTQAYGLATLFAPPAQLHPASALLFAAGFCFPTAWLGRVALLARRNKRQSNLNRSGLGSPKVDW